jgi:hypothetical protein
MSYDCICVDFNINKNKDAVLEKFSNAKFTPFVDSYFFLLKSYINEIKTSHFWLLTTLQDYTDFDFDFIPEQFQQEQIHVWHNKDQKEGNTFLVPTEQFKKQINSIKHLRDFKDINYHEYEFNVSKWPVVHTTYKDLYTKIKLQKTLYSHYLVNSTSEFSEPSFWEDLKLYVNNNKHTSITVPRMNFQEELYEYDRIYFVDKFAKPPKFDIFFLHNNEPQAKQNYKTLQNHLSSWGKTAIEVNGIAGRDNALKYCAELSTTDYFYVVPAKIEIDSTFKFDYQPSTLKSNRHYIFGCFNKLINYMYGHQAVVMYYQDHVLNTPEKVLDFTLASAHEYVNHRSGCTNFDLNSKVNYRTTFREVTKLLYQQKTKPTVETDYILEQWKNADNQFTRRAYADAETFCSTVDFKYEEIIKTFEWEFVDALFFKSFG